jgi:hypothetical protein
VGERLEEEIDQLVITSKFLQFLMNRPADAMKSEDALFVRDKQSRYDLFDVLPSIRNPSEKEYSISRRMRQLSSLANPSGILSMNLGS